MCSPTGEAALVGAALLKNTIFAAFITIYYRLLSYLLPSITVYCRINYHLLPSIVVSTIVYYHSLPSITIYYRSLSCRAQHYLTRLKF